jgi:thymidylate synthase (FAD)
MKVELLSITPNAEELIETAARECYQSEPKGEVGDLIKKLLKATPPHESVLEHASATFRISEVSRALSHQLVRHRICSYSQQSQRYVKEHQFDFVIPPSINQLMLKDMNTDCLIKDFENDMFIIQNMYNKWKARGLKNEDARFVLPNACCTSVVMSGNFRQLRHIIEVRCDKHAQWEIRAASLEMLKVLYNKAPHVFEDLKLKFIG